MYPPNIFSHARALDHTCAIQTPLGDDDTKPKMKSRPRKSRNVVMMEQLRKEVKMVRLVCKYTPCVLIPPPLPAPLLWQLPTLIECGSILVYVLYGISSCTAHFGISESQRYDLLLGKRLWERLVSWHGNIAIG